MMDVTEFDAEDVITTSGGGSGGGGGSSDSFDNYELPGVPFGF